MNGNGKPAPPGASSHFYQGYQQRPQAAPPFRAPPPDHLHRKQQQSHYQQPVYLQQSAVRPIRSPMYPSSAPPVVYHQMPTGIVYQSQQFQPPQQQAQQRQAPYYGHPAPGVHAVIPQTTPYQIFYQSNPQQPSYFHLSNGGAQSQQGAIVAPAQQPQQPPPQMQQQHQQQHPIAPQAQYQPAQPQPQPQSGRRRPGALRIEDPSRPGRDVLDDVLSEGGASSDSPDDASRSRPGAAVKDEFYRRVREAVDGRPSEPPPESVRAPKAPSAPGVPHAPHTPVVSAISDSPEIVPMQSAAARPQRSPDAQLEARSRREDRTSKSRRRRDASEEPAPTAPVEAPVPEAAAREPTPEPEAELPAESAPVDEPEPDPPRSDSPPETAPAPEPERAPTPEELPTEERAPVDLEPQSLAEPAEEPAPRDEEAAVSPPADADSTAPRELRSETTEEVSRSATIDVVPSPRETTPATRETTPATRESTPALRETTPVPRETISASRETTPAPRETTPAPRETTPSMRETAPAAGETTLATGDATPAVGETTPSTRETTPETAPRETTPAPRETTPAPRETIPTARETTSAPREATEMPPETIAAPRETGPAPCEVAPASRETTPAASEAFPAPAEAPLAPAEPPEPSDAVDATGAEESAAEGDAAPERRPSRAERYPYRDGQWSPSNPSGKKIYDPEFLKALRNDPQSMKKPENAQKLELIASDGPHRPKPPPPLGGGSRGDAPSAFMRTDATLFPDFMKGGISRGAMPGRKSQQGKAGGGGGGGGPKGGGGGGGGSGKPAVIHVTLSLREDVKLNEAENAWKPTRLKTQAETEDENRETAELLKKFRSILNKLTPEKFDRLIAQILELNIDTEERLKGVIDLVFEKAISEPNFALTYASLCHRLKTMKGTDGMDKDFRYLIVTKCQVEFEKASADETASQLKEREIDECEDPEKKKELKRLLAENELRMRRRSVGNVRFIGELFKQAMLTPPIMIRCIEILIRKLEEETLECLCKLLTTIGKNLEDSGIDLHSYFMQMQGIVAKKDKRVSSRIRFMLQDVIELRSHSWEPRQQAANPKTMDQIQQEVEMEQLNRGYASYPPPKQDRPSNMNKRGGSKSASDEGWSSVASGRRGGAAKQTLYTVDSGKLKTLRDGGSREIVLQPSSSVIGWGRGSGANAGKKSDAVSAAHGKAPSHARAPGVAVSARKSSTETSNMYLPLDDMNRDGSPVGPSAGPPPDAEAKAGGAPRGGRGVASEPSKILEMISEVSADGDVDALADKIRSHADGAGAALRELLALAFAPGGGHDRTRLAGRVSAKFVVDRTISVDDFVNILKQCADRLSDTSKDDRIADSLSRFYRSHRTLHKLTLRQMHRALSKVIELGKGFDFLKCLFADKACGPDGARELWEESPDMRLVDWMPAERVPQFLERVPLDFLAAPTGAAVERPSPEAARERLFRLVAESEDRDAVNLWIKKNVADAVGENWFVRALTEAIFTHMLKPDPAAPPRLDDAAFERLKVYYPLLIEYVGNQEKQELQCLFAIQRVIHELEHPSGFTGQLFEYLWESGEAISTDGFVAWEENTDPQEQEGKAVMVLQLTSFFTSLKTLDESSDGTTPSVVDDEY